MPPIRHSACTNSVLPRHISTGASSYHIPSHRNLPLLGPPRAMAPMWELAASEVDQGSWTLSTSEPYHVCSDIDLFDSYEACIGPSPPSPTPPPPPYPAAPSSSPGPTPPLSPPWFSSSCSSSSTNSSNTSLSTSLFSSATCPYHVAGIGSVTLYVQIGRQIDKLVLRGVRHVVPRDAAAAIAAAPATGTDRGEEDVTVGAVSFAQLSRDTRCKLESVCGGRGLVVARSDGSMWFHARREEAVGGYRLRLWEGTVGEREGEGKVKVEEEEEQDVVGIDGVVIKQEENSE